MSNKACCLKLKGCMGLAKETEYGGSHRRYINGMTAGLNPIAEAIAEYGVEKEFGELVDAVVSGGGDGDEQFMGAMKTLNDFGMKLAQN